MRHLDSEHFRLERELESKLFGIVIPYEHTIGRDNRIITARHNGDQIRSVEHFSNGHTAHFVCIFICFRHFISKQTIANTNALINSYLDKAFRLEAPC